MEAVRQSKESGSCPEARVFSASGCCGQREGLGFVPGTFQQESL